MILYIIVLSLFIYFLGGGCKENEQRTLEHHIHVWGVSMGNTFLFQRGAVGVHSSPQSLEHVPVWGYWSSTISSKNDP